MASHLEYPQKYDTDALNFVSQQYDLFRLGKGLGLK